MLSAFFASLLLAVAAVTAPTFAGVTPGETVQQLLVERGDPLRVFDRQGAVTYMYLTPSGNALTAVRLDRGYVVAVEALNIPPYSTGAVRQSALGVRLGDNAQAVRDLKQSHAVGTPDDMAHGAGPFRADDGLDYYFDFGLVVTGIDAHLPADRRAPLEPNTTPPVLHSGKSFDDAIIIKADSDLVGVRAEYEYLSYHSCTRFTGARVSQALFDHDGKHYDKLTLTNCEQSSANGDYYFDISDFFGKK